MFDVIQLLEWGKREHGRSRVTLEFLEAYEQLCLVSYYGTRIGEDAGLTTGGDRQGGFAFADLKLLGFKTRIDRRLTAEGAEIRRWAATRKGTGARRAEPADHHRGDLDRTGRQGYHDTQREEEA